MTFVAGNRFWEKRSSVGRNPTFSCPSELWSAACEYFAWCEDHPLSETKAFAFQGIITKTELPKMRAMTLGGLCLFLDIAKQTLYNYKKNPDSGFLEVITRIEETIYQQKFSGAAADLLNANIIARDLGLAEKNLNEHTGKDGGAILTADVSEEALKEELARLGFGRDSNQLGSKLHESD